MLIHNELYNSDSVKSLFCLMNISSDNVKSRNEKKEEYKMRQNKLQKERAQYRLGIVRNYFANQCMKCGYDFDRVALQLHHLFKNKHKHSANWYISRMNPDKIIPWILNEHLILLCPNCRFETEYFLWTILEVI